MSDSPGPSPGSFAAQAEGGPLEARYGLPPEVKFCTRCVISNQRPNSSVEFKNRPDSKKQTIRFDAEGVCDACRFAEKKEAEVDWAAREAELRDLLDRYRGTGKPYDILVPGSGGKDSAYASHLLKYKYGMHPLTVTWAPHVYTEIGWRNFERWIHSGFDNLLFTPNGKVHRLLTKLAFENLVSPFQPFVLGQKNLPPKVAAQNGIHLVFYGENEAEYGNPIKDNYSASRGSTHYATDAGDEDIWLGGVSISEICKRYGFDRREFSPYLPGNAGQLAEAGVDVRYLGYYIKWTPQEAFYYASEHCGFEPNPERTEGTYSKYNSIDDRVDGYHYFTTWIKFGIGRATYDAAQELRNGPLTREEGVALVHRFDGEFPKRYFREFLEYVDLSEERFWEIIDGARSPHLWRKDGDRWVLRHRVS